MTQSSLQQHGFSLKNNVAATSQLSELLRIIEEQPASESSLTRKDATYAVRHLLRIPAVHAFSSGPIMLPLAQEIIGANAFPVRAMLLDKIVGANWYVGWHQDLTIAVEARIDSIGFGPWSMKAGIQHVQPPLEILQNMVALRFHFDAATNDNGALNFVPGSHKLGILRREQIDELKRSPVVTCSAERGSVLLMHPLILHSSSPSKSPNHRRVLHIEYAATELPNGLRWAIA